VPAHPFITGANVQVEAVQVWSVRGVA